MMMQHNSALVSRKRRTRGKSAWLWSVAVVALIQTGCYQTAIERLQGRWFNGEMSIRFRPNGTVLWNAKSGRSEGLYRVRDDLRANVAAPASEDLVIDMIRDGRRVQYSFDLEFLGNDRIRLTDLKPARRESETIRQFVVLSRAEG